jgi:mannan endo-1,4-beta-mannosidase
MAIFAKQYPTLKQFIKQQSHGNYPIFYILGYLIIVSVSCKKSKAAIEQPVFTDLYSINNGKIYNYNNPVQLIGANALHVFSAGSKDMNAWNMDIAREFVGNVKETPLVGLVLQDANGAYLHPLQNVVDSNRKNNRLTIICAFGWDGKATTTFTGKRPTLTSWWNAYKTKLQEWALHFKNQKDVWLEVWNEPYRYDRADGYTDEIWEADMNELVAIVRNAGNTNVLLVPCAEQGQDESVVINKAGSFLNNKTNILFDIHAYEKWLLVSNATIDARLQQLKQRNIPVIFGEVAPLNAGVLMNPAYFLNAAYNNGLSICAWLWKYDANDTDALLNASGLPNNNNNNNWGSLYKNLAASIRKP